MTCTAMRIEKIPSVKEMRDYYDTIAATTTFHERMYQTDWQRWRLARLKEILSIILPFTSGKVLEIGCADGILTHWLAERVEAVTAVDIAAPCIERCKGLGLENVTFLCGTAKTVRQTGFDLVIASEVLEHCVDPEAEMSRLRMLAKGILATVPISEMPNEDTFSVEAYHKPKKAGDGSGHIWSFRPDTFKALFEDVWFYQDNGISAILLGR